MKAKSKSLENLRIPHEIMALSDAPMRCGDRTVLEFFVECVANGTSPRMAEALALQQAPGIGVTDTTYIADQNRFGRSILERMGGDVRAVEDLRRRLAKHGYKLQDDDHYIPTVARFPGDPEAIVNHKQTLGDLKKRLRERGTAFHGEVEQEHKAPPAKKQRYRLNPRIVRQIDRAMISENPDLARTPERERHEAIIEKHGSKPVSD